MNRMLSLTALCHPSGLGEEEREHLFCENLLIIGNLFLSDFLFSLGLLASFFPFGTEIKTEISDSLISPNDNSFAFQN